MTQEDGDEHRHPTSSHSVKVNTNAAIFAELDSYSQAFVVRDHEGGVSCSKVKV